jgi:hypothetical protein
MANSLQVGRFFSFLMIFFRKKTFFLVQSESWSVSVPHVATGCLSCVAAAVCIAFTEDPVSANCIRRLNINKGAQLTSQDAITAGTFEPSDPSIRLQDLHRTRPLELGARLGTARHGLAVEAVRNSRLCTHALICARYRADERAAESCWGRREVQQKGARGGRRRVVSSGTRSCWHGVGAALWQQLDLLSWVRRGQHGSSHGQRRCSVAGGGSWQSRDAWHASQRGRGGRRVCGIRAWPEVVTR